MNDSIPDLKFELMNDGIGEGLILLEQDNCGNIDRVAIHPMHLRYMAEKFGLVKTSDPQAHSTIDMLTRRLRRLNERVSHLANKLAVHDELSSEASYATATADIAAEYCADLKAEAAHAG